MYIFKIVSYYLMQYKGTPLGSKSVINAVTKFTFYLQPDGQTT